MSAGTALPDLMGPQSIAVDADSAANDFVVTAHTTTPSIWFTSNTVSGQSVDNLAAAAAVCMTSGVGGSPKSRLYSQMNCDASSQPTRCPPVHDLAGSERRECGDLGGAHGERRTPS